MFLSKVEIDPRRRLARKYLGSPQVMHAVVMKAAASTGVSDADEGRVLWRVDRGDFGLSLYIVSPGHPDLEQLSVEAGLAGSEARTLDYSPFLAKLAADQVWAFRLAANPTKSLSQGKGVRGKRVGHVSVGYQQQWLLGKSEGNGFSVFTSPESGNEQPHDATAVKHRGSELITRRERPVFSRSSPAGGRDKVTINTTVFEGALRITDVEAFRRMLVKGLGPSKAYGCGLMTLAPLRRG